MSLVNKQVDAHNRFPYYNLDTIYLKCGTDERLRNVYFNMINQCYPECSCVVYPVIRDDITNAHFTFGVSAVHADSYAGSFQGETYPWHFNAVAIIVPYGNQFIWPITGTNWLAKTASTLRCIWHAARILPNDSPQLPKFTNIGIPWLPLDKKAADCTDTELADYVDIVLSSISGQIWISDRRIITPHVCGQ